MVFPQIDSSAASDGYSTYELASRLSEELRNTLKLSIDIPAYRFAFAGSASCRTLQFVR
jgi:hypothetical protein